MIDATGRQKILIIDDSEIITEMLTEALKDSYAVITAMNGERALELASEDPLPDIVLLDVQMPGMNGYEVCARLKAVEKTRTIPVIFITGFNGEDNEYKGLELGALDYISKPFSLNLVKTRIRNHLELKRYRDNLEELVQARTRELELTQEVAMESMGTLAEFRDPETGGHIKRTQHFIKALAVNLKGHDKFRNILQDNTINLLYKSAPLHDIGKVAISDSILLKPGKLTGEEFEEMKKHTVYGRDVIHAAAKRLGDDSFLHIAEEIAYTHHEKWNGAGYPQGLRGEEIPVSGRMMAIADVYDALISKRVYKPPMPHQKAVSIIRSEQGVHFDPDIVEAFMELSDVFRNIALQFADFDEEREILSKLDET
ncbi:MAG TPA: HD domain-containing phosphohydrolase [Desulfomonilia bacterium]|nr:HD domain-containing phosphohydrolase [Desulfomonilia bacterium]